MTSTRRAGKSTGGGAPTSMAPSTSTATTPMRTSPFLPTPLERIALGIFPFLLIFGTVFSVLSPSTSSASYDHVAQTHHHTPGAEPSYFARKSNIFNVYFVKIGWAWLTFALVLFISTHPGAGSPAKRGQAILRWATVTGWWFLVTQWCFGPAMIDRGFRWTGGKCDVAELGISQGTAGSAEVFTAVACKASGGKWKGGHDISGHVFLLTTASALLMNEVGWTLLRWTGWAAEERCVVMADGATKSAGVEAEASFARGKGKPILGLSGKVAVAVLGLNLWMLLMTAIYFHTWFEKLTGLLAALIGVYVVYYVPRFVPAVRSLLGLPGI